MSLRYPKGFDFASSARDIGGTITGGLELKSPAFTYDGSGRVTRIDYESAAHKTFTYTGDALTRIDTFNPSAALVSFKTFSYTDGVLSAITETEP